MELADGGRAVRVGIVGAGAVARRHATTLSAFHDVRVAAVTDTCTGRAVELAQHFGALAYPRLEPMLDGGELDALYVCVPPFAHGPPEMAAIDAGLPLFIEKPVALDLATAEEIGARVEEAGLITAVGYHWRYLDIVQRAQALLRDRPPQLVVAYWLDKVPPAPWWTQRACSGGQVIEQATHALDLLRFVVGEVSDVYARSSSCPRGLPRGDIAEVSSATLSLQNGAVGAMLSTCLLSAKHRTGLDVFCAGLGLELSEDELVVRANDRILTYRADGQAKRLVDRAFIDAVKGEENRVLAPYPEALATHRLACAISAAADDGRLPHAVPRPTARRRREGVQSLGVERPGEGIQSLGVERPGKATFFELPLDRPPTGGFHVETLYTGLSAGTELTFYKGTNPSLHAGWDAELGAFSPDRPARAYPVRTMGYMEVGRVTGVNGADLRPGQLVAMAYGHKSAHAADPARDRFIALPPDLDPLLGIYVAHMGPICANGLLHAAAELVGPDVRSLGDGVRGMHVLVMGAGVVGLLTALFAAHHGAASVCVADTGARRLRAARGLGFDVVDQGRSQVWRALKARHRFAPGDCGVDVAFQCRARPESLAEALRSLRPQGSVIDLAFYTGGAEALRLGEEFHHNGLTVRCAQIGRVPRGLAPRWHRDRLSAETIELLRAHGRSVRRELVTDILPLDDAPHLLEELATRRREVLQAVFAVNE
jgi:predicted dehydrogenase/NADPH:quinone reductase-like Zn-dependent oxidoreductase